MSLFEVGKFVNRDIELQRCRSECVLVCRSKSVAERFLFGKDFKISDIHFKNQVKHFKHFLRKISSTIFICVFHAYRVCPHPIFCLQNSFHDIFIHKRSILFFEQRLIDIELKKCRH